MTTQYRWLYERTGPFTWREKYLRRRVELASVRYALELRMRT